MTQDTPTQTAVAAVAREHYGRLLAVLARRGGDPAEAEDVLSEAFARALKSWPQTGVPDHPDAWLLTVARSVQREHWRHDTMARSRTDLVQAMEDLLAAAYAPEGDIPDERLRLMFVCAHPAIDPKVRSALMLQLVLGVEVAHMASAFLLAPSTLAQRLVRAKTKIRSAGIPFEIPETRDLPARLRDVIEAIYGAYTRGRALADETTVESDALADDALQLAQLLAVLMPEHAEALGLAALLTYCESRRAARFDAQGRFVPLVEQDTALWNDAFIATAETLLVRAAALGTPGPMQLEAAIQSAHASRRRTGTTPWPMIAHMYSALCTHWPSLGARVGEAVAVAESGDPERATALLALLPREHIDSYPAYWAATGHVARMRRDGSLAAQAFRRAAGLTAAAAVRAYLLECAREMSQ